MPVLVSSSPVTFSHIPVLPQLLCSSSNSHPKLLRQYPLSHWIFGTFPPSGLFSVLCWVWHGRATASPEECGALKEAHLVSTATGARHESESSEECPRLFPATTEAVVMANLCVRPCDQCTALIDTDREVFEGHSRERGKGSTFIRRPEDIHG